MQQNQPTNNRLTTGSSSVVYPRTAVVMRSSPVKSPRRSPRPTIGRHRLYKAPQASIRANGRGGLDSGSDDDAALVVSNFVDEAKIVSGNAFRRRAAGLESRSHNHDQEGTGFSLERQQVDISMPPETPRLWMEDDEPPPPTTQYLGSSPDKQVSDFAGSRRTPPKRRVIRSSVHTTHQQGNEHDLSSSMLLDDDSCAYSHSQYEDDRVINNNRCSSQSSSVPLTIVQVLVLILLGGIVYDSHHRVKAHKVKLQQYDEERSHILEQMMWIDKAAKKVHNKYSQNDLLHSETRDELVKETNDLKDEIEQLQLRIQLNARDQISDMFGDKPLHVALKFDTEKDIVLALSDDTPHAAATLLRQFEKKMWKEVVYEAIKPGVVVQASSRLPTNKPLLEFVEKSRGCHEVGSVALHQLINQELTTYVLRIHLQENAAPMSDNDICVGKILTGLDYLQSI